MTNEKQIKSIIFNGNVSNNNNNLSFGESQPHKYIIKFIIELIEGIISDISKIKPFIKYKDKFSKIKTKKVGRCNKICKYNFCGDYDL